MVFLQTRMVLRSRKTICIIRYLFCILVGILIYIGSNLYTHSKKIALFTEIPETARTFVIIKEEKTHTFNRTTLKKIVQQNNEAENIHNIDLFGPITKNTNILVICVHSFSDNLKLLLASLSIVKGIQDELLIFSHSIYDENVNRLIKNIDFCRVIQIFYPLSIQVYPNEFPGFSSNDCPFYLDANIATYQKCTGSSTPDVHGHFRNPENSEKKHHWWWTANKVFDDLNCLKEKHGLVVFLDDDHYLFEDFLYVLINMRKVADSIPFCNIVSLGAPNPNDVILNENDTYRLEVTTWESKDSEVIGFDYSTWNTIVSHYDLFCLLDDHSWSRSLQYISLNRLDGRRFKVISIVMPRAFKSSCKKWTGVTNCGINEGIFKALSTHKQHKKYLFPPFFEVYLNLELLDDEYIIFDILDNKGGWNDNRDKELCNNLTLHKMRKIFLDMKSQFN